MKEFVLLGYSGHAFVIADAILSKKNVLKGYCDLKEGYINPYGLTYLGEEKNIMQNEAENVFYFPSVGSAFLRKKMIQLLEDKKLQQSIVCHSSAIVSFNSKLEYSVFVSANVVINPMSYIKKGVIVNTAAIIEHECTIGEYSHIGPGAVLAGNVTVGYETFIGANSVVIQGKKIGNNVIVGAGSVVISDIGDNQTWVGNPAKRIK